MNYILKSFTSIVVKLPTFQHLRTSANPSADVLREIAHRPLKNLLNVLAKINRVDALLSLQPYLESITRTGGNEEILSSDSGIFCFQCDPYVRDLNGLTFTVE